MNRFESLLLERIISHDKRETSFHIQGQSFSYGDLCATALKIQERIVSLKETVIGLYATDSIQTYASILALWFSGKAYVPLNPIQPRERHKEVIESVGLRYILSSDDSYNINGIEILSTKDISPNSITVCNQSIRVCEVGDDALAYILFTSGSTGKPKGVQITRGNVAAFIDSMNNIGLNITKNDRCLQPFDLTFDFSVSSYVIPLVKGASIYTVPLKATKFTYIAQLLEDHHLTVLQMVPSMIRNLLPYLDEVDLSSVRYNILCGEALTGKIIKAWHTGNEKMVSYNMYGPTEDTVFCTYYLLNQDNIDNPLSNNDTISIGKTFINSSLILLDENQKTVDAVGIVGELCLSGEQLTPGYWQNSKENEEKFFNINGIRHYRTGDLCYYDESHNLMFVSRKDFQIKINGFRVELGEIENQYFKLSGGKYSIVIPYTNSQGNIELAIVIEGTEYDTSVHRAELAKVLPAYEVPNKYLFTKSIPLNQNGKVDRKKIKEQFKL